MCLQRKSHWPKEARTMNTKTRKKKHKHFHMDWRTSCYFLFGKSVSPMCVSLTVKKFLGKNFAVQSAAIFSSFFFSRMKFKKQNYFLKSWVKPNGKTKIFRSSFRHWSGNEKKESSLGRCAKIWRSPNNRRLWNGEMERAERFLTTKALWFAVFYVSAIANWNSCCIRESTGDQTYKYMRFFEIY